MPERRPSRRLLVTAGALALLTVAVGFSVGYLVATRLTRSAGVDAAAPPASAAPGTVATRPPTTEGTAPRATDPVTRPGTDPPSTVAPTTTSTTAAPPSTTAAPAPVTTAPTTRTVVVTTATTAPGPASTLAPPRVEVQYAVDVAGRLVIPRGGTAALTIANSGGLASQWIVTGTGFSARGATQGTLQPGQRVIVVVAPPAGDLPKNEITGTISVLGAVNPSVPFVIPRV